MMRQQRRRNIASRRCNGILETVLSSSLSLSSSSSHRKLLITIAFIVVTTTYSNQLPPPPLPPPPPPPPPDGSFVVSAQFKDGNDVPSSSLSSRLLSTRGSSVSTQSSHSSSSNQDMKSGILLPQQPSTPVLSKTCDLKDNEQKEEYSAGLISRTTIKYRSKDKGDERDMLPPPPPPPPLAQEKQLDNDAAIEQKHDALKGIDSEFIIPPPPPPAQEDQLIDYASEQHDELKDDDRQPIIPPPPPPPLVAQEDGNGKQVDNVSKLKAKTVNNVDDEPFIPPPPPSLAQEKHVMETTRKEPIASKEKESYLQQQQQQQQQVQQQSVLPRQSQQSHVHSQQPERQQQKQPIQNTIHHDPNRSTKTTTPPFSQAPQVQYTEQQKRHTIRSTPSYTSRPGSFQPRTNSTFTTTTKVGTTSGANQRPPPPRRRMPPPPTQPSSSSSSTTVKGLFQKFSNSLDTISKRVDGVVSSAVSTVDGVVHTAVSTVTGGNIPSSSSAAGGRSRKEENGGDFGRSQQGRPPQPPLQQQQHIRQYNNRGSPNNGGLLPGDSSRRPNMPRMKVSSGGRPVPDERMQQQRRRRQDGEPSMDGSTTTTGEEQGMKKPTFAAISTNNVSEAVAGLRNGGNNTDRGGGYDRPGPPSGHDQTNVPPRGPPPPSHQQQQHLQKQQQQGPPPPRGQKQQQQGPPPPRGQMQQQQPRQGDRRPPPPSSTSGSSDWPNSSSSGNGPQRPASPYSPTSYASPPDSLSSKVKHFLGSIPSPLALIPSKRDDDGRAYISMKGKTSFHDDGWGDDEDSNDGKGGPLWSKLINPIRFIKFGKRNDDNGGDEEFDLKEYQARAARRRASSSSSSASSANKNRMIPMKVSKLLDITKSGSGGGSSSKGKPGPPMLIPTDIQRKCQRIGKLRSLLDVIALGFLFLTVSVLLPCASSFLSEYQSDDDNNNPMSKPINTLKHIITQTFVNDDNTIASWAPYTLTASLLTLFTNRVIFHPILQKLSRVVHESTYSSISYAQLYLRLTTSTPLHPNIPTITSTFASDSQIYQIMNGVRLHTLSALAVMFLGGAYTHANLMPVVTPMIQAWRDAIMEVWKFESVRSWPLDSTILLQEMSTMWNTFAGKFVSLYQNVILPNLSGIIDMDQQQPVHLLQLVARASVFAALILNAWIVPQFATRIMTKRCNDAISMPIQNVVNPDPIKIASVRLGMLLGEDGAPSTSILETATVANLGSSSATRLYLQGMHGDVETTLNRWQVMQPPSPLKSRLICLQDIDSKAAATTKLYKVLYGVLSGVILGIPIALLSFTAIISSNTIPNNHSMHLSLPHTILLMLYLHFLTNHTTFSILNSSHLATISTMFIRMLSTGIHDIITTAKHNPQAADLQLTGTISPTKGLAVTDFWAAHSQKRAWAVQGITLVAKNGEIVLLLGDGDASGKTRLLTAIAETIYAPPKRARTTTPVRGVVSVGGVDVKLWEREGLKRSVGCFLNDVGCIGGLSEVMSGCMLEEILEPPGSANGGGGGKEKVAVNLALQITGLSSTLLQRLPSKQSSILSTHEDELSPLLPAQTLSPSEWNKILLTRVLARCILHNDNPISSTTTPERSLLGSVLLLDDGAMAYMNEIEEASIMNMLRSTGAAVVMSTNRWALGRFVDRIVVLKNGAVVECGTHAELLALGPMRGVYAARWNQMTLA